MSSVRKFYFEKKYLGIKDFSKKKKSKKKKTTKKSGKQPLEITAIYHGDKKNSKL